MRSTADREAESSAVPPAVPRLLLRPDQPGAGAGAAPGRAPASAAGRRSS
jgi:hypothetical protein